jgi:hypothetical protein
MDQGNGSTQWIKAMDQPDGSTRLINVADHGHWQVLVLGTPTTDH